MDPFTIVGIGLGIVSSVGKAIAESLPTGGTSADWTSDQFVEYYSAHSWTWSDGWVYKDGAKYLPDPTQAVYNSLMAGESKYQPTASSGLSDYILPAGVAFGVGYLLTRKRR